MKKNNHIAIEGIDGSGKSSVGKKLAEALGYTYISKPMSYLIGMDRYMECVPEINETQNDLVKTLFYACGNAYAVGLNKNIVTDRHLLSNYYHNKGEKSEELYKVLIEALGKPKLTVLLLCDNEKRKERMVKRNPKDKDIENVFKFNQKNIERMKAFLDKYKFKYIVIDTTFLTVDETVEKIIKELENERD